MATIATENNLVSNQGKSPLVSYNFMLRVEGLYDLPCKSVHAFSRELEYDLIQEGGLNDYVHMLRKPISKPFTLEVERYVGVDYIDPLPEGADLLLPILLMVSRYPTPSSYAPFVCARTYVFTGCTVMKKTYGDLIGDKSDLLVETTTIAYREFSVVNIPWSEAALSNKVAPPEHSDTGVSSLEKMRTEMNSLIEKAKTAQKNAGTEVGNASTITENLQTALSNLTSLEQKIETQLDTLYSEIEMLETASPAEPAVPNTSAEATDSDDTASQVAAKRALAQKLEAFKQKTKQVHSEIETANNLATGSNNAPNRLQEANDSYTKATEYLNKATTAQTSANSATELWDAQVPINQAKSNAQACINRSNAAIKQISFFQGKLETSSALLQEASSKYQITL